MSFRRNRVRPLLFLFVGMIFCATGLQTRSFGQLLLQSNSLNGLNPFCEFRSIVLDGPRIEIPSLQELIQAQSTILENQSAPMSGILNLQTFKQHNGQLGEFGLLKELSAIQLNNLGEQNKSGRRLLDPLNLFGSQKTESQPTATTTKPKVVKGSGTTNPKLLDKKLANPNIITNYFHTHPPANAEHPLLPAIEVAKLGLKHGRKTIRDYSAIMHKRERVDGTLMPVEVLEMKIRTDKVADGMNQSPMSVYLKFLSPGNVAGREVIWKKGRNNDRLTVHERVLGINLKLDLVPTSSMARQGNRHPLTEIGFENLTLRMIEKGIRDCKHGECDVNVNRTAKINGRDCTMIEIVHPKKREHFDFHIARVFIDDELNVPLRYANYSWPNSQGGEPVLEEEYTFTDIKLNSGLSDIDFDTRNPAYNFPR